MNEIDEGPDHDIVELLPWYAAGTLSHRDVARVEQALARNPALARHYALAREELIETIGANEKLGAPSARAVERLFDAIDAEPPARRERAAAGLAARLRAFLASLSPRTLAWSASAAVLAIVLQAGTITTILVANRGADVFHSAGSDDNARGPAVTILVTFAPHASATEITAFLDAYKASIVAGPMGGSMFRLRVPVSGPGKDELLRLVNRMQDEKVVSFVAPSE